MESRTIEEKCNRRFLPYLKSRRTILAVELPKATFNTQQIKMSEPNQVNIKFLRECSWTDSDSPTEESEEEIESDIQAIHPRPTPPFRSRLSHRVRLETVDVMESREEASRCLRWNPNVPLGEIVLDRIELWLQIWGLSIEYHNARVAEKLARTAREIIKIDWRYQRPRNIRFLRVRIALDPKQPLAAERYGYPIVTDPQNNFFSNNMRAFLHRASRRTTRVAYGNRGNRDNQLPLLNIEHSQHYERGSSSGTAAQASPPRQEEEPKELQVIPEEVETQELQMINPELVDQETSERDNSIAALGEDLQAQMQSLMLREERGETQQSIESVQEQQDSERTHILETRLEQLEQRFERGYNNLADLDYMQFALNREHARFEHLCGEIVRQSAEMLEGLQNRHMNDPNVQPDDNNVRWISFPQGGAVYTNARLQIENGATEAESSRMGSRRNDQPSLRSNERLEFELNHQMEQHHLNLVESQITSTPTAEECHTATNQGCQTIALMLGTGSPVNPTSA
ncbi:hypothetical protein COLO4_06395 [Corchorus olitorius]|uniref:Uncharacterized protein n=1 Tax=Corchorus olitorius TaxID=93759 RepID=A0A1R3KNE0_9ROSI|nr:hypothetical protein COLO4_06395 [Corchorus olitorius]